MYVEYVEYVAHLPNSIVIVQTKLCSDFLVCSYCNIGIGELGKSSLCWIGCLLWSYKIQLATQKGIAVFHWGLCSLSTCLPWKYRLDFDVAEGLLSCTGKHRSLFKSLGRDSYMLRLAVLPGGSGLSIRLQAKWHAACWEAAGRMHWIAPRQLSLILCTWEETSRTLRSAVVKNFLNMSYSTKTGVQVSYAALAVTLFLCCSCCLCC